MGKFERTRTPGFFLPRNMLILSCFLLAAALVVLAISLRIADGSESDDPQKEMPRLEGLVIESVEEQGENIILTTPYCQVAYPYAFSDLIQVEAQQEDNGDRLMFFATINEVRVKLYAISFGIDSEISLGTLTVREHTLPVGAEIFQADETLNQELQYVFVAAQETFHDVVTSLAKNGNFTPAS